MRVLGHVPVQPLFQYVDLKHRVIAEVDVILLFLTSQRSMLGLEPRLLFQELLGLLLKSRLDDVGHVHETGPKVFQTVLN